MMSARLNSMYGNSRQHSHSFDFQAGQWQAQIANRATRWFCVNHASIAQNFPSATQVRNQLFVRLKPLTLLELKTQPECFPFEDL